MTDHVRLGRATLDADDALQWIDVADDFLQDAHQTRVCIGGRREHDLTWRHGEEAVMEDVGVVNLPRKILIHVFVRKHHGKTE